LSTRLVDGSTRETESPRSLVTQTHPPPTATSDGCAPTGICTGVGLWLGSSRNTELSVVSATQIDPKPTATASGCPTTSIGAPAGRSVPGSIRFTAWVDLLATQTLMSPTVSATGPFSTRIVSTGFGCAGTVAVVGPPSSVPTRRSTVAATAAATAITTARI